MPLKRPFQGDEEEGLENGIPLHRSNRKLFVPRFVRDMFGGLAVDAVPPEIENLLRRAVREEVEHAVSVVFGPSPRTLPMEASPEGYLRLRFVGGLPSPIFTGSKIESADGSPIRIELVDMRTNCVVNTGPLSAIKIEIVPLKGDFGLDDEETRWTVAEFNANIVHEREGRRPLIIGEKSIPLRGGVGYLGKIIFTDNSSWVRSRHFRLGARTEPHQEGVKEARSGRFIVKDHRGELYRKHYPPSLKDEVWRLTKISKDGTFHLRLASQRINTVEDFLRQHEINSVSLRKILGSNVPNRIWNAIVEHAASCTINANEDESYVYTDSSQRTWLLFNCIYKLVGASFDGQTYSLLHDLPVFQRLLLQNLKRHAYANMNEWAHVSTPAVALPVDASSTPFQCQGLTSDEVEVPFPRILSPVHPSVTTAPYGGGELWPSNGGDIPIHGPQHLLEFAPNMNAPTEPIPRCESSNCFTPFSASMPGNVWFLGSETEPTAAELLSSLQNFAVHIPSYTKRKAGWSKIRAAVMLRSVKQDVAAKRKANPGLFRKNSRFLMQSQYPVA